MPNVRPKDLVDWSFVATNEGGRWLDCYLIVLDGGSPNGRNYTGKRRDGTPEPWNPKWKVKDSMGVTVATGVDLVAISPADLEALPVSAEAKETLRPFAGKKGHAVGKLLEGGKRIKEEDAAILDDHRGADILARLIETYNASVRHGGIPFEQLPAPIRTAIYSFAYQYGPRWGVKQWDPGKGIKAMAFWRHITAQDFPAAVAELESGYVGEKWRRDREAAKMREVLPFTGPTPTSQQKKTQRNAPSSLGSRR